jgi:RES domain-containing protein
MAPFTHINPRGSRFSNGTYGVYYAAERLETAIRETVYHFSQFAADSNDPPRREDMRVLMGKVDHLFEDINTLDSTTKSAILDKNSYASSQAFAEHRRENGTDGLVYPSVRHDGGQCIAVFWPDAIGIPIQERHLKYEWDGSKVGRYFNFKLGEWVRLP